jgi:hypothetical protein
VNDKLAIFIVGDSESLSRQLQILLFDKGYRWLSYNQKYFNIHSVVNSSAEYPACISTHENKILGCHNLSNFKNHDRFNGYIYFDANTQWDQILQFIDNNFQIKIEDPNIYFKGIGYKI